MHPMMMKSNTIVRMVRWACPGDNDHESEINSDEAHTKRAGGALCLRDRPRRSRCVGRVDSISRTTGLGDARGAAEFLPISWIPSWRRSRCIPTRCWPRRWRHPRIRSKSCSSNNGSRGTPALKDKALADAVAKQPWDPSIQAMAALPDVVKRLADDIQWTTDLGNAFLAQQADVMEAVQRMRRQGAGHRQFEIERSSRWWKQRSSKTRAVIVIEQAAPGSRVRAVVRPGRGVRTAGLSVSADLLPACRVCTRPVWPSRSASASPWVRSGAAAEAGAGEPAGATTTSRSTTTTTSCGTRTSEAAEPWRTTRGSTDRSIAAARPYRDRATANRYRRHGARRLAGQASGGRPATDRSAGRQSAEQPGAAIGTSGRVRDRSSAGAGSRPRWRQLGDRARR